MNTQQFLKGLLMALVSVVVAAFSATPIDFLLLAVTAVSVILTYSGKNLISVLHSNSPAGTLSFINIISGLLIVLGTGILESVGLFVIDGAINWTILGKVVLSVTFTYLGSTLFAPPHTIAKKKTDRKYISKASKGLPVIFFLFFCATLSAQSPWNGFFSPKAGLSIDKFRVVGLESRQFYFRPAAEMTAVQFTYNKDTKIFDPSTFKSAGVGLGYQHYVERSGQIINNYGVNALLMLDASNPKAGIAIAGTINALQFVNLGCGYNFTGKQFFLLTGAVYNF